MEFPMTAQYKAAILQQYHINISRYPVIQQEAETFLQGKGESFALCLRYLYGHMAAQDVLSIPPEVLGSYVNATLEALEKIDYCKTVPAEIFFPYVLYHRVNSEYADGSRSFLLKELLPHVQGKSMEQASVMSGFNNYRHFAYAYKAEYGISPRKGIKK